VHKKNFVLVLYSLLRFVSRNVPSPPPFFDPRLGCLRSASPILSFFFRKWRSDHLLSLVLQTAGALFPTSPNTPSVLERQVAPIAPGPKMDLPPILAAPACTLPPTGGSELFLFLSPDLGDEKLFFSSHNHTRTVGIGFLFLHVSIDFLPFRIEEEVFLLFPSPPLVGEAWICSLFFSCHTRNCSFCRDG